MTKKTINPYQAIFQSAVEGVIATDKKGKIILANPAAEKLFGYRRNELTGISIESLVPVKARVKHAEHRKEYIQKPVSRKMGIGMDLVGLRKTGDHFPVEISLSNSIIDEQPAVIAFIIDITQRKNIEAELSSEKETIKTYLDIAGAIFMVLDTQGNIKLINQKGCKLLGDSEKNILGKNWFNTFSPPERKDKIRQIFQRIITDENQKRSFEDYVLNKKGEQKAVAWDFVIIRDKEGNPASMLCSGVDVTERKRAEIALKQSEEKLIVYAAELEKRVGDRTKQLAEAIKSLETANIELQEEISIREKAELEAKKAFEKEKELNELKSRFVSLASHEFRTPLSTIMSSVSLIAKYNTPENADKKTKHINRIKNNVNSLIGLLNDFLNMEMMEDDRLKTNCKWFDMDEFMHELHDEMQAITKSKQKIKLANEEPVGKVYLDIQMLKNISFNLISNAIKYSAIDGLIEVAYNKNGVNVEIIVKDYGIGIPGSEQSHLFKRFFRAKNAAGIQGTGLGLYIVRKYVEQMKGSVKFTSEYQIGSTFQIQLPLKYDESTTD